MGTSKTSTRMDANCTTLSAIAQTSDVRTSVRYQFH